jgi:hypothetical protein
MTHGMRLFQLLFYVAVIAATLFVMEILKATAGPTIAYAFGGVALIALSALLIRK